jgi:hypothetical protein
MSVDLTPIVHFQASRRFAVQMEKDEMMEKKIEEIVTKLKLS